MRNQLSTDTRLQKHIKIWGGIECTINRVGDQYFDQLEQSGHYKRAEDIDLIASLGIKACRYPILWEKHQPCPENNIDLQWAGESLSRLRSHDIDIIAGLVHHGSGPHWVNFYDGSFENGLAAYARTVATQFPWIEYYTPVNEPVTTARFCGLYGLWYPHGRSDYDFAAVLISECKATVLAMQEIRKINPEAKLIQTEDLGKTYSTPLLSYQAEFENNRRWIAFDLLCGKVLPGHPMWDYLLYCGIDEHELYFFAANPCPPYILGFNHYITSERFLDDSLDLYPVHTHGSNGKHEYADVELVRVKHDVEQTGAYILLKEAWQRYGMTMAITEAHLNCTREEQMRWLYELWVVANKLLSEGVDICALTAWAIFGAYGWDRLLTAAPGNYESGIFDLSNDLPEPTALAAQVRSMANGSDIYHPILQAPGWWHKIERVLYRKHLFPQYSHHMNPKFPSQPILILGKTGTLGHAFARICEERNLHYILLGREELDVTDSAKAREVIKVLKPWAVINATGYVRVDDAELDETRCFSVNADGPGILASLCKEYGARFIHFSTDLVFDGNTNKPYTEHDKPSPLNVYGHSKYKGELLVADNNPDALIIRTSAFFSPWDHYNFVDAVLSALRLGQPFTAANDATISPTYVPDLVHHTLQHVIDGTTGILHLTNCGKTTWAEFAMLIAIKAGYPASLIMPVSEYSMHHPARRPRYSVLCSERGIRLPYYEDALQRYFAALNIQEQQLLIAVAA